VVNGVAVTANGKRAVSACGDGTVKVWDVDTGRVLRTLEGHSNSVYCVSMTPDGKRAVSASGDYTLKVWELDTGRVLRTMESHSGGFEGVAITADGKLAVSASSDKTLKVWDLDGRPRPAYAGRSWDPVERVTVTPGREASGFVGISGSKAPGVGSGHRLR